MDTDTDVMRQVATKTLIGLCLCLILTPAVRGDGPPPGGEAPLARARRLIQAGDRAAAVTLLEDALIDGPAGDRRATLELLGQSYEAMAREAEAAGRSDDAARYRDNLAILERARRAAGIPPAATRPESPRPGSRAAAVSPRPGPSHPASEATAPKAPATKPVPKAANDPVAAAPASRPAADAIPEAPRVDEPPPAYGPPVLEAPRSDPSLGEPLTLPEPADLPRPSPAPAASASQAAAGTPNRVATAPAAVAPTTPAASALAPVPPPAAIGPADPVAPSGEMLVNPGAAIGDASPAAAPSPSPSPSLALPQESRPGRGNTPAPEAAVTRPVPSRRGPALALPESDPAAQSAEADRLFQAERYDHAGHIYAALAAHNQLSAERRPHWAYCRYRAVVRRINAHPRSRREWDEIEGEIRNIQRLAPGVWFGDYLMSKIAEIRRPRGRGRRPLSASGNAVIRGSDPDEPPASTSPSPSPSPSTPAASSSSAAPARSSSRRRLFGRSRTSQGPAGPPAAPAIPGLGTSTPGLEPDQTLSLPGDLSRSDGPARRPGSPGRAVRLGLNDDPANSGRIAWQVHETANFRIYHCDPELAERAASIAEATRSAQVKRWGSPAARATWSPRCELYLFPDRRLYAETTGQPESSPGISSMANDGMRVVSRRMNLRADHPRLLTATLPHEVTHIVMADLFVTRMIPRWADEGLAVLAEPVSEQHRRRADLKEPLDTGRVFEAGQLMTMDYPEPKDWKLFYAQSVSLTRFLVDQGPPERFIQFVREAQRLGPEPALRDVYQIDGLSALQERWLAYARSQAAENVAISPGAEAKADAIRRD